MSVDERIEVTYVGGSPGWRWLVTGGVFATGYRRQGRYGYAFTRWGARWDARRFVRRMKRWGAEGGEG